MATDFLDEKRDEMAARVKELQPLVEEYQRLQAAVAALDAVSSASAAPQRPPAATRARATPPGKRTGAPIGGGRGRPKGSGKRADQALALVNARPGITVPQIAEELSIAPNYLYRVLPRLAAAGLVIRDGRGWHPAPTS